MMKGLIFVLSLLRLIYFTHLYPIGDEQKGESEDYQIDDDKMMLYLHKYGYLRSMTNVTDERRKAALLDFQQFMGIHPTGEMNTNTNEVMRLPRCGMPDKETSRRVKRYGFSGKRIWDTYWLTYKIQNYTPDMDRESVDTEIERAVNEWSRITNIYFKRKKGHHVSDVNIYFDSVDGNGDVLGYAYSPINGTVVLDDDELWTKNSSNGVNLFQVAVHEFGHTLGLGHSDDNSSVMYPIYVGYVQDYKLNTDDLRGISALYKINPPQSFILGGDNELLCSDTKIDAVFGSSDYFVYVLKGHKYWKFTLDFILVEGPALIRDRWSDVPDHVDAAFTYWNNVTYFLKGPYMWKYKQDERYKRSQLISYGFPGIPDDIDAALIWSGSGKIYFFKGKEYWMLNPWKSVATRVNETYPLPISRWNGLPNNLDAAIGIGGSSYFFKGGSYYKYDDLLMTVQIGYPRPTTELFGCL